MINHTPLYHELYKFTNEYKINESKKIFNKFIFKPSVQSTDGSDFINSNTLYSSNLDIIPNAKVYIDNPNNKYYTRIKLCIPFSEFGNNKTILNKLNTYVCKSIHRDSNGTRSSLESLKNRKSYPYFNTFNSKTISKWLYELQFNLKEFYEATGLYLVINRRVLTDSYHYTTNYNVYDNKFINSNYKLDNMSNIQISVKNNVFMEIDFIEKESNIDGELYELYIYNKPLTAYLKHDSSKFDLGMFQSLGSPNFKNIFNNVETITGNIDHRSNLLEYNFKCNNSIEKSLVEVYLTCRSVIRYQYSQLNLFTHITLYDHEYVIEYNNEYDTYKIILSNDLKDKLNAEKVYLSDLKITINIKELGYSNIILEKKDYFNKHYLNPIIKSNYYKSDNSNIKVDEENLRNCLPFSLEHILNKKSTLNISKIKRVLYSNIEFKNSIPCIKYTINSKHDSIMFFKGNKLLTPTFIESDRNNYIIFISIENMLSKENFEKLIKMKYGVYSPTDFIDLNTDDLWIVYDTDSNFIENARYDVRSIYKYINISKEQRYSISEDDSDELTYVLDDNGKYVLYKNMYIELGSKNYYLDGNNRYVTAKPENYNGDIYRKTRTNEYLLPINKNIDPSKIVLTIEDYHNHDESIGYYRKDPEGIYILLDKDRYYHTYNIDNKSSLYIKIDGNYIKYNDTIHSEYKGSFYIKKTAGYVIPPYYYSDDVRYTKIGKKCVLLSNLFNIKYDEELVSVNSYYNDDNTLIRTKTYDKKSLISEMVRIKYGVQYPTNDTYYKHSDTEYRIYRTTDNSLDSDKLYYKSLSGYIDIDSVNAYVLEISQYMDMNRVYKFTHQSNEVLYADYADPYEYMEIIDALSIISNEDEMVYIDAMNISDNDTEIELFDGEKINFDYMIDKTLDGGYSETDEYIEIIDPGYANTYSDAVDYVLYDFNFTAPYTIKDNKIKAYRIDSSYSKYFINSEDEFLAYTIPNQLINSENKLMTFLDGKFTDEYVINKSLHSRLFGGDTILSLTEDPTDFTGKDYSYRIDIDGDYYFDMESNTYVYDPSRSVDDIIRESSKTYYKQSDNTIFEKISYNDTIKFIDSLYFYRKDNNGSYIGVGKGMDEVRPYIHEQLYTYTGKLFFDSELYDKYDKVSDDYYEKLPDNTYCISDTVQYGVQYYYKLKNGTYIKTQDCNVKFAKIASYEKYFKLVDRFNGLSYISTRDYYTYTTPYSKNISNVFMCNMRNLSLYQNSRGIDYENKIFTVNNSLDSIVKSGRMLYKDIYFPPLSLKYMLFFINGKFANPFIQIITPQRFALLDTFEDETINDVQIYIYDKYLYDLNYYNDFFNKEINEYGYNIYTYNDTMWDTYKDDLILNIKSNDSIKNISYEPKDTGYSPNTSLLSLYEIFGKYILNKCDIDNDYTLYDEIREYFALLFDEDNRMKLELMQDKTKRKYIY